jgi:DNA replication protein DnaC
MVEKDGREYAVRCVCRRSGAAAGPDFVGASRLPARYEECSFASFEAMTPSLRAAVEKCLLYCNNYPHLGSTEEGLGILFTGDNGVGKTHLAVSVLRELADKKGVRGQFWDFHELMREIKSSYDPETRTTEVQVLAPVVEADVLLLDDLGAWKMTDWMNDTLFYILNSRYLAKRPTLITTNFQDVDRQTAAAADNLRRKEYLIDRIGQRLRSRLMEMCLVVPVDGTDYRQARQASNRDLYGGRPVRR